MSVARALFPARIGYEIEDKTDETYREMDGGDSGFGSGHLLLGGGPGRARVAGLYRGGVRKAGELDADQRGECLERPGLYPEGGEQLLHAGGLLSEGREHVFHAGRGSCGDHGEDLDFGDVLSTEYLSTKNEAWAQALANAIQEAMRQGQDVGGEGFIPGQDRLRN